jgi:membrane associated rhomboid family serine protease
MPIRDTIPSRYAPVVTWWLIAINGAVFLYELSLGPEQLERLFYLFGIVPARYTDVEWARWIGLPVGAYWPFLTSMFLHGGWGHIIGNMWMLWIFGDNVEEAMGALRFLLFYLMTGLLAGLTHVLTNPSSMIPTVGASGAIAGVLGAYFVLYPHARIIALFPVLFWPEFVEVPAATYLFVWFLNQTLAGALSGLAPGDVGGIAFWAHVGGFVAGVVLRPIFVLPRSKRQRPLARDEYGIEGAWAV